LGNGRRGGYHRLDNRQRRILEMSDIRVGSVWIGKPDRDLRWQKIVVSVDDKYVRLEPYGEHRRIQLRRPSLVPIGRLHSSYRLLWKCV